jgi:hypothetical protein
MEGKELLRERFVVDSMLGKVAKWLRILGYDVLCEPIREPKILEYGEAGWFLLTRRRRWCGRPKVLCLHENAPMDQLRELHSLMPLRMEADELLSRCIRCNERLERVDRAGVFGRVPDYVFETLAEFHRCSRCGKIYWRGSHPERMIHRLRHELGICSHE